MNPQEWSAYITNLLRSEPEVFASFFMGVLLTAVLVFALRHWVFPGRDSKNELTRKDAEIARKEAEVARMDAQVARIELKLANTEENLLEKKELIANLLQEITTLPLLHDKLVVADSRCAQLEAENLELVQVEHSLKQTIENLRTELALVTGELAHSRKWLKVFDEENARLTESGSHAEG